MELLKVLKTYQNSEQTAMITGSRRITYSQLWEQSDKLAGYIKAVCGGDRRPVVVYGHKDPRMPVAFLACAKSGRAYVPVDISVPRNRVENIIDSVEPRLILTTEEFMPYKKYHCVNIIENENCFQESVPLTSEDYVKEDDVYYIIFTSGSTGNPKGVQITYGALNRFTEWALNFKRGG